MSSDIELYFKAAIAMLVITAPFDPIKILFFGQAISSPKRNRLAAALTVSTYVTVILFTAALIGQQLLKLIGINLNAFSAVGGLIIASMGFEMLYGGGACKAQGQDQRTKGPEEGDSLLIPLALPLVAGPGAITTTITIAAQDGGLLPALIGSTTVALAAYASYAWLGRAIESAKPATVVLLARIGGLLLATIGAGGLKTSLPKHGSSI